MAEKYLNPMIAMTVLAIVFFLILVAILVIWCKRRRHVEVISVQPKLRSQTTTVIKAPIRVHSNEGKNGEASHNGNGSVQISDDVEGQAVEAQSDLSSPDSPKPTKSATVIEETETTSPAVTAAAPEQQQQEEQQSPQEEVTPEPTEQDSETQDVQEHEETTPNTVEDEDKGQTNPTFQADDED